MACGKLEVEAKITMEVNYEELSSLAEIPLNGKPKATYTPSMKNRIPLSKMSLPKGSCSPDRKFECTASDFHCIRILLRGWRKAKKLNENEVDVMTGYSGKFFSSMTAEEKQNFLEFFHAIRERLNQAKALVRK